MIGGRGGIGCLGIDPRPPPPDGGAHFGGIGNHVWKSGRVRGLVSIAGRPDIVEAGAERCRFGTVLRPIQDCDTRLSAIG